MQADFFSDKTYTQSLGNYLGTKQRGTQFDHMTKLWGKNVFYTTFCDLMLFDYLKGMRSLVDYKLFKRQQPQKSCHCKLKVDKMFEEHVHFKVLSILQKHFAHFGQMLRCTVYK